MKFLKLIGFTLLFFPWILVATIAAPTVSSGDILPLMYHDFTETDETAALNPSWSTSRSKFKKDIEALYALGYESLSIEDYLTGNYERGKYYFILTFDDGYKTCYEIAFPVLLELNAKADLFINTSKISEAPERMVWEQVKKMDESELIGIYSHMSVHLDATQLTEEEFEEQIEQSCRMIEKMLGTDKNRRLAFAYPYGLYNTMTYEKLVKMGFGAQAVQGVDYEDIGKKDFLIRSNIGFGTNVVKVAKEHRQLRRYA